MQLQTLVKADINLLVALQILLEERNVTRAADRLHITQPAMSRTLGRLRDLFADPLFNRVSHGLVPTPRAEQLQAHLPAVLDQVSALIAPAETEPANFKAQISIATVDVLGQVLFPDLLSVISKQAPGITLHAVDLEDNHLGRLESGQLDFSICQGSDLPVSFKRTPLAEVQNPVVLCRRRHPLSKKKKLVIDDFLEYPFVVFLLPKLRNQGDLFDQILSKKKKRRRVAFYTNSLMTALKSIMVTNYLAVVPQFLVDTEIMKSDFLHIPLKGKLIMADLPVELVSHERVQFSPVHSWMEQQIVACVEKRLEEILALRKRNAPPMKLTG